MARVAALEDRAAEADESDSAETLDKLVEDEHVDVGVGVETEVGPHKYVPGGREGWGLMG